MPLYRSQPIVAAHPVLLNGVGRYLGFNDQCHTQCLRASLKTRVYSQPVLQLVSLPEVSNIAAKPLSIETVGPSLLDNVCNEQCPFA